MSNICVPINENYVDNFKYGAWGNIKSPYLCKDVIWGKLRVRPLRKADSSL